MNRYIELVAARHGVSPEEVRAEIQEATGSANPEQLVLRLTLRALLTSAVLRNEDFSDFT